MKRLDGKGIRGNILLALTTFVFFMLLFEGQLSIPAWLQPVGRLHHMLLHFPILLVVLGALLDMLRFYIKAKEDALSFAAFAHHVLFAGALLSGATVIMGIFLAQEHIHDGAAIAWHKWTGVFAFLFSVLVYTFRHKECFTPSGHMVSSIVAILVIVFAGFC